MTPHLPVLKADSVYGSTQNAVVVVNVVVGACRQRPLRRSSTTSPDSVSPHIGWWTLAVVTDLDQPAFWKTTGATSPQSVWKTAERQVNLTLWSLMDRDSARHPGDVTENGVATFDDVIHDWKETAVCFATLTLWT